MCSFSRVETCSSGNSALYTPVSLHPTSYEAIREEGSGLEGEGEGDQDVREAGNESERVNDLAALVRDGFLGLFELLLGSVLLEGDLEVVRLAVLYMACV